MKECKRKKHEHADLWRHEIDGKCEEITSVAQYYPYYSQKSIGYLSTIQHLELKVRDHVDDSLVCCFVVSASVWP